MIYLKNQIYKFNIKENELDTTAKIANEISKEYDGYIDNNEVIKQKICHRSEAKMAELIDKQYNQAIKLIFSVVNIKILKRISKTLSI